MRWYIYELITEGPRGFVSGCVWAVLALLSFVYAGVVSVWSGLFELGVIPRRSLPRPVISIGNVTWGGVGKTPLVIALAADLFKQGKRPVVLSRGYRPVSGDTALRNDESLMMSEILPGVPVVLGRDRFRAGTDFLRNGSADVFILDDGFQQWGLHRDLDIVVVDASNPFGRGFCLPAGILREPRWALGRADIFVLTKTDSPRARAGEVRQAILSVRPDALIVDAVHRPVGLTDARTGERLAPDSMSGQTVGTFCGIGDPDGFLETVLSLGVKPAVSLGFEDHYQYTPQDAGEMADACAEAGARVLLTTAKDAAKIKGLLDRFKDLRILVVNIELDIQRGRDELSGRVAGLFRI